MSQKNCPCGGIILADTDDCTTMLCINCANEIVTVMSSEKVLVKASTFHDRNVYVYDDGSVSVMHFLTQEDGMISDMKFVDYASMADYEISLLDEATVEKLLGTKEVYIPKDAQLDVGQLDTTPGVITLKECQHSYKHPLFRAKSDSCIYCGEEKI